MNVRILVDMNLSPNWATLLSKNGWHAVHWSAVGDARATDSEIMRWARENHYVVFTHDLDFGTMLALTRAVGPSVIQVRSHEILTEQIGKKILAALFQHQKDLADGALVVIDSVRSRVKILPL